MDDYYKIFKPIAAFATADEMVRAFNSGELRLKMVIPSREPITVKSLETLVTGKNNEVYVDRRRYFNIDGSRPKRFKSNPDAYLVIESYTPKDSKPKIIATPSDSKLIPTSSEEFGVMESDRTAVVEYRARKDRIQNLIALAEKAGMTDLSSVGQEKKSSIGLLTVHNSDNRYKFGI